MTLFEISTERLIIMSPTDYRSAKLEDKRARWEAYFRKQLGDNHPKLQAAVDAAMRAAANRASSQQAAAAGIAAARSNGHRSTSSNNQGSEAADPVKSGKPGMVVGRVRNMQRHTQIANGGSIITLEFRLESDDSTLIQVQMQGALLDGAVRDGDIVEVRRSDMRGGRIVTDHVYNRSSNSDVYMRRGFSAATGKIEAHWGGHWKLFLAIILGIAGLLALIWFAWFAFIASNFINVMDSHSHEGNPPASFCEQVKKMGGMLPPGC
ncbi:hypothetical protein [Mycobacterium colombiense]|uniref:hypothetical protein n=1 Tax=Mycobacterium colombiense TaxID=339268 RepID=UPI0012DB5A57|nr:hypothetical protein [Mycobacterium colombiense]